MCLFFTLFYRAIFLKSIQLHREMVVCPAQEKKTTKKVPLKEMHHAKDKRGNRNKRVSDTEQTKQPNLQPTAVDQFISPHNAC